MRFCRIVLSLMLSAAMVGLTTGCPVIGGKPRKTSVVAPPHPDRGPHGGPMAFWTDEYLLEVCIDRAAKEATVYVMKGNVSHSEALSTPTLTLQLTNVDPPKEVQLKAAPSEEDPKGSASCFRGTNDVFATTGAFYGIISGKVSDNDYVGEFDERARSAFPASKHKK